MIKKTKELAELTGIILGDGSFYVTGDHFQLDIAFNRKEELYFEYVKNLVDKIIKTNITKVVQEKQNCIHLRISNKNSVLKLLSNTIEKPGNKITNQVTIPDWIWKNSENLSSCVRGLMDTDGSIYRLKPHWPNLFQMSFKNRNETLLRDTHKAFMQLGLKPSKVFGDRFVLTRQDEIQKYFKLIGTNNRKKDSPVVQRPRGF